MTWPERAVSAAAWYLALALLALALRAAPCPAQDEENNPYAADPAAALEGEKLFARSGCVPCHGPHAEGAIGPNLIENSWIDHVPPSMVYRTISRGRRGTRMVAFGERLRPDEIWKIVEFLLATGREAKLQQAK
ncbi:MAG TPA: c-type cytochrome [Burkholderiales bacterium]|nr:c-type cytochrome [Burkholderiales bacterium]